MRTLLLTLAILVGFTARSEAEPLIFEGRIEAIQRAQVYSRAEGRVAQVFATAGMRVEKGQVLARLESDLAELAVEIAAANLARHEALLTQAQDRVDRAKRLSQSGSSSTVSLRDAETELGLVTADHRVTEVALERAKIDLADTIIRAPQNGIVEAVAVGVGALLEFDAGLPPLFEIIEIDEVRVIYEVPYAERLQQMARLSLIETGDLLRQVRIDLALADGTILAQDIAPQGTSVRVDPDEGTLLVWAEVPNPNARLRPGMRVSVRSTILNAPQPHQEKLHQ
ncbi:MAG: efflux RND transporter periplasmic adaptor subunit [Pseudomonadota bacterium]